jgi:peptidyl-prolyl cis-trans isomerase SurA
MQMRFLVAAYPAIATSSEQQFRALPSKEIRIHSMERIVQRCTIAQFRLQLSARSLIVLFVAAGTVVCTSATAQSIAELDRIVAVVNSDVIVESQLDKRVRRIRAELREKGTTPPNVSALERQVLDRLILDRLQLQIAKENGLRVEDEELNQTIDRIAAGNKLSLREFRDVLERDGLPFSRFRAQVRDEILLSRVRQRSVERRVKVSPREIDNFLATMKSQGGQVNEYNLSHILIAIPEAASAEQISTAKDRATQVLTRARNDEDFAALAAEFSDGQQALQGGDLGWRKSAELPTIFADAVPGLKPGDASELIRSPSGFHIVKMHDLRGDSKFVVTQTRARHILMRPNDILSDQQLRVRLTQLRVRIENNESFEEIARASSDDTVSASSGGDLGWLNPGATVPEFERTMKTLADGEISEPFRTQFGWHIVQVLERREHDDTEQVKRTRAATQIRKRKVDEEVQNWLRQIRDEAYVELRLEE